VWSGAKVYGWAKVQGGVKVYGGARVQGRVQVWGGVKVRDSRVRQKCMVG